jgi:transcriptional regulator with XRE-family HTH domain
MMIAKTMTNKDISTRVRERIKAIRLKKQLSQGDIARTLGVHPAYISQIERGERNPTLKNIEKIAKAMGISVDKLLK